MEVLRAAARRGARHGRVPGHARLAPEREHPAAGGRLRAQDPRAPRPEGGGRRSAPRAGRAPGDGGAGQRPGAVALGGGEPGAGAPDAGAHRGALQGGARERAGAGACARQRAASRGGRARAAPARSVSERQVQVQYNVLKAPFAGVVGDVLVRLGDYATAQTVATSIAQADVLEASIAVPAERARAIRVDTPVELLDDRGEVLVRSSVYFVAPLADPRTQLVDVKAVFRNTAGAAPQRAGPRARRLRRAPGAAGAGARRGAAERRRPSSSRCRRRTGKSTVARRPVTLGALGERAYVVEGGLQAGDRIAVSSLQSLARRRAHPAEAREVPGLRAGGLAREGQWRQRARPGQELRSHACSSISSSAGPSSRPSAPSSCCWPGCVAIPTLSIAQYPDLARAHGDGDQHLRGRQLRRGGERRHHPARAGAQRRGGHALHHLHQRQRRRLQHHPHLRAHARRRDRRGGRAEPRGPRRARACPRR